MDYPLEQHKARLICGDPVAEAYEWISAYAKNLTEMCDEGDEVTVDELLECADSQQEGSRWGGDYISRGGAFEGYQVEDMFWKKYAIFRGKELENLNQYSFFSCSC